MRENTLQSVVFLSNFKQRFAVFAGLLALVLIINGSLSSYAQATRPTNWEARDASHVSAIDLCRQKHPDVAVAPDAPGGISVDIKRGILGFKSTTRMCVYGSLSHADRDSLAEHIARYDVDLMVLRSLGGDVDTWLLLAETMVGKVDTLLVDDICFSSCANYMFPIAQKKIVYANSLVGWHGGPNIHSLDKENALPEGTAPSDLEHLRIIAQRTETLYQAIGISSKVLADTNTLKLTDLERQFLSRQTQDGKSSIEVSGFAIDPAALEKCYGFSGLDRMWHPFFFQDVFDLGQRRSNSLRLLMRPAVIQDPACGHGH